MRHSILVLAILVPSLVRAAAPTTSAQAPASDPQVATTVRPAAPEQLDPNVFRVGPIQAKDAATRTKIADLYKQQFELRQNTLAQLKELAARSETVSDSAARLELNKEGGRLKQDMLLRHMELGLEIAQLNADTQRVAEFELALDQVRHPEKYMPAIRPDAEQVRRQRELGK